MTADLLWLGYEDVSGLWEVSWEDGDDAAPGRTAWDRRVGLLVDLLRSGLIELAVGPWSSDFDTSRRLTADDVPEALADPRSWQGPDPDDEDGAPVVRFRTTDAGFAAYRAATGWGTTSTS
ncbi:hypothetical protein [Isoptericola sp. NPDC057559]|uniref:hypothetical protein n=1 Tax=Isoptericola sp. NPDC057559 TaxID=3346168 RepID=UPI0036C88A20